MRLQAALNGPRERGEHPGVAIGAAELARDGAACAALGAASLHLHPRGDDDAERLDAVVVDAVVAEVRAAARVPVGVTTSAWIEPDPERRAALLAGWTRPDFATVNLSEDGAVAAMRALLERGIGIEAGLWEARDAERLVASGLADRVVRCLVEPLGEDLALARRHVEAIHAVLDAAGVRAPRLQHSDGPAAWPVLRDALARGDETRIGLEDALAGPNGEPVARNAELVAAAIALG
jgi:uncharacterized protein (DUF849 family)